MIASVVLACAIALSPSADVSTTGPCITFYRSGRVVFRATSQPGGARCAPDWRAEIRAWYRDVDQTSHRRPVVWVSRAGKLVAIDIWAGE
jgi:hypothetical protein